MVQDGIAIIKVGPALTFSLREGLFALSMMEKELIEDESKRADFMEVLEEEMLKNPVNRSQANRIINDAKARYDTLLKLSEIDIV